jgi:hypothetical protein
MSITRDDERYLCLNQCGDEEATEAGALFRCWLKDTCLGGWNGENIYDFYEAVMDELKFVDADQAEECFEKCDFYELTWVKIRKKLK